MIMEAGKSHDQLFVSCRPRKANGVLWSFRGGELIVWILVSEDLSTRSAREWRRWCISTTNQAESEPNLLPPIHSVQPLSGMELLTTLTRVIFFIQFTNSDVNLF